MNHAHAQSALAIYASSAGYAFVLFDGPSNPIDRGVKTYRTKFRNKNAAILNDVAHFVEQHRPDFVVIEHTTEPGTRRTARIRRLYLALENLAFFYGLNVCRMTKAGVRACFSPAGAQTRYEIAEVIAQRLSAIAHRLPKKRHNWKAERPAMWLFNAAALGVAFYDNERRRSTRSVDMS